jgi:hypothetical protein
MIDPEYFARKRVELGLGRGDLLTQIQIYLDTLYPAQVRAKQLHRGVLRLVTPSASVASELRFRQIEILAHLHIFTNEEPLDRLQISIG